MAHINIEHLSFTYPQADDPALRGVSLTIERGAFVLVCGTSGGGKTTLLRHLKPALTPHGKREGRVLLDGRPLDALTPHEQAELVAFVAQDPNEQIVCDRVWHELAFGLENLGVEPVQMRSRVAEMASYFGIGAWFHRDVAELSGGQKQLLGLAAAMVLRPQVLVLDEPTSQLDPIAAADFIATVRKLNVELGTTVVMTEHRLEEVYPLADQVVVMDGGGVVACGTPGGVAAVLHARANGMERALPTPARVFLAAGGLGPCPLSVREGRRWLGERLATVGEVRLGEAPKARPMPCGESALRLREVWFRYEKDGSDVLRGASLEVPRGLVYALMGANGAGKSTLLKVICGACRAQRGRIEVLGRDPRRHRGRELFRGCLAMLPQDPASLFVKDSVHGELAEMAEGPDAGHLDEVADLCEIAGLLKRHPRDLSGGEQQRVALAKVLLTEPELILLDEPTKGLDAAAKEGLARIIERLAARGATVVMASHDVEFCAGHAMRVGMFFDGQVVAEDEPRAFFAANAFYTTAARRMGRGLVEDAVVADDLIVACQRAGETS